MRGSIVLQAKRINKSYGGIELLRDLSFNLEVGELVAIFGDNGTGKSTLFNILTGFVAPESGEVLVKGVPMTGRPSLSFVKKGIGRVWQSPRLFRNISVKDNFLIACTDHPGSLLSSYVFNRKKMKEAKSGYSAEIERIAAGIGLLGKLGKTAGVLSLGEQKLLSLGMLQLQGADTFLLDEPFAGINPAMVDNIANILESLKQTGISLLIIEHLHAKTAAISDRTYLLQGGSLVPSGKTQ
jgi:ABC-type branched-subunit amino acid transport system ATPase component